MKSAPQPLRELLHNLDADEARHLTTGKVECTPYVMFTSNDFVGIRRFDDELGITGLIVLSRDELARIAREVAS